MTYPGMLVVTSVTLPMLPTVQIFVANAEVNELAAFVLETFEEKLPAETFLVIFEEILKVTAVASSWIRHLHMYFAIVLKESFQHACCCVSCWFAQIFPCGL